MEGIRLSSNLLEDQKGTLGYANVIQCFEEPRMGEQGRTCGAST